MRYVTINGTTATIKVDGRFDICNTRDVYAEAESAVRDKGCVSIVVDFEGTTYFDSSVIRDLSRLRRSVKPENFSARNASGKVLEMLRSAKLDSWIKSA